MGLHWPWLTDSDIQSIPNLSLKGVNQALFDKSNYSQNKCKKTHQFLTSFIEHTVNRVNQVNQRNWLNQVIQVNLVIKENQENHVNQADQTDQG